MAAIFSTTVISLRAPSVPPRELSVNRFLSTGDPSAPAASMPAAISVRARFRNA